ncbi:sensor histidine kinase [Permianibacter aggregans]|nr:sensor histidine kinase [Permianibacter aggregans]
MQKKLKPAPKGIALLLNWRRVSFVLIVSLSLGLLMGLTFWQSGVMSIVVRTVGIAFVAMLVFGLFEQWPRRLPSWLARWVLQVLAVGLAMPVTTFCIYLASTPADAPPFWQVQDRLGGFMILTVLGVLLAPWAALGALVRQKDAIARHQALAFELERSELERQATDARLHLLQAQVAPHFLFNTLANVQALVESGSPKAPSVLRSLIAYLRAAVPRLHEPVTTLGLELDLVRAYLDLMRMRMPDRLQFALHVDSTTTGLRCPPMTLLTLVENAVRHGIDPSEEGGRIDIFVERTGERCLVRVSDTGIGLGKAGRGLGTGLSTLRERLQLVFGDEAELRISEQQPRGVRAELDLPARGISA